MKSNCFIKFKCQLIEWQWRKKTSIRCLQVNYLHESISLQKQQQITLRRAKLHIIACWMFTTSMYLHICIGIYMYSCGVFSCCSWNDSLRQLLSRWIELKKCSMNIRLPIEKQVSRVHWIFPTGRLNSLFWIS